MSYNRFVERQAKVGLHLLFLQTYALGKCTADRGYISRELFEILLLKAIHLVIKLKKNMKCFMNLHDKILRKKLMPNSR